MGSAAMIYIPSFLEIGHTDRETGLRSHKPTLGKLAKNEKHIENMNILFESDMQIILNVFACDQL
jgi:hypothetical protein